MNSKIVLGSRIILGLIFVVFGLNGLLMVVLGQGFIPTPTEMPPEMATLFAGFMAAKYLMPMVKLIEIISGLLFLWGKFLNLAIILITPIIVNILGIHLFVDLSGAPIAILLLVLITIMIKSRWSFFKGVFFKN